MKIAGVPKDFVSLQGFRPKVRSNLGPTTAELGPKPCTMTQNKARRTNKIDFLQLPWAQEVSGSNPDAPTNLRKKRSVDFARDSPAGSHARKAAQVQIRTPRPTYAKGGNVGV